MAKGYDLADLATRKPCDTNTYNEYLLNVTPGEWLAILAALWRLERLEPLTSELIEVIRDLRGICMGTASSVMEEAKAVLEALHRAIQEYEGADLQKIAARKAVLREQAKKLGVK